MDKEERIKVLASILNEAQPVKPKRLRSPKAEKEPLPTMSIVGNSNVQAGRDVNINPRLVSRPVIQPGPQHITEEQAFKLQELVKKAAEIEATANNKEIKDLFAKWWGKLKKRFKATSYKTILLHDGEVAISWMQQEVAKLRPKLRRTDNDAWRNEHYSSIWARARQRGIDKPAVYGIVNERIGKAVSSLTELGERDLKKLYNIIMAM